MKLLLTSAGIMNKSIEKANDGIEKAKKGDKEAIKYAQDEYMKAVAYDKEREIIEGVKSRASEIFDELENEIVELREKE